jgi:hypothetical protein
MIVVLRHGSESGLQSATLLGPIVILWPHTSYTKTSSMHILARGSKKEFETNVWERNDKGLRLLSQLQPKRRDSKD